ncbi:glycosyl hydrolase family 28-related protein [Noviluteimonas gilva]|uniref:glycosyl hydrolase family 28-related protein n=1 Tax=Noviluteimonas gilva TaxID=2682097 RepID=UPI002F9131B3
MWRYNSGVPSNALGVNGDWVITSTGDAYQKAAGAYGFQVALKGPAGPPGSPGGGGSGSLPGGMVDLVADFGADPTGVANCVTALNNAKNSGAAIIWVPPGTYRLNSQIDWDQEVDIWGAGVNRVTFDCRTSTHGFRIRPSAFGARVVWKDFTIDGSNNTQGTTQTYAGVLQQRKIFAERVCVTGFRWANVRTAPYDADAAGAGGTKEQAAFFSEWRHCRFSESTQGPGFDLRFGFNCTTFYMCQFDRNGNGPSVSPGLLHRTDGAATYGTIIFGGQASYNSGLGFDLAAGTDVRTYALYTEYNHSPTNTTADGYTNTAVSSTQRVLDIDAGSSRSLIDGGVMLNASPTRMRAPNKGVNDATEVFAGGQRFHGSARYMKPVRGTAPANAAEVNIAGVNTKINELITALRNAGVFS